jgi:deoxyribose-phosphate aldolase
MSASDPTQDDALVELIAQTVRARLMAGGTGPGYTREQLPVLSPAAKAPVNTAGMTQEQLRETPCHEDPTGCSSCGMCVVRRPWDARIIVEEGAARIAAGPGTGKPEAGLAPYIDHTLLKPEATREEFFKLAEEARKYKFASVCVNSANVRMMAQLLEGSGVPVCAVVGFPLGAMTPHAKAFETREAVRCGAREIDMVLNIGAMKSHDYALVESDIRAVVDAAKPVLVKVILETSKLDQEEKIIACALSKAAGAAFVKTSTGFGGGGATAEDIALMRRIVGKEMGVKASGGIRDTATAQQMIAAGASRLGASASVAIVTGAKSNAAY